MAALFSTNSMLVHRNSRAGGGRGRSVCNMGRGYAVLRVVVLFPYLSALVFIESPNSKTTTLSCKEKRVSFSNRGAPGGWNRSFRACLSLFFMRVRLFRPVLSLFVRLLACRTIVHERVPRHHAMFFGPGQSSAAYYNAAPNTGIGVERMGLQIV
jgi:hypothetical protein